MECTENPSEEAGKPKRKTKSKMMDDAEAVTTQLEDCGVSQLLDIFNRNVPPVMQILETIDPMINM